MAWVQHSFLLDVEDQGLLTQNFQGIARLVASIKCYHLDYPRNYETLDHVMDAVSFGKDQI